MSSGKQEAGFTYLIALLLIAIMGAALTAAVGIWSQSRQREKEAELLWIGNQFKQAIGLYYQRTPGSLKRYPEKLEDLLEDHRYLSVQRYLRRLYADPMTGKPDWGLVSAPTGGVMGVYSRSAAQPILQRVLPSSASQAPEEPAAAAPGYSGWKFSYAPPETGGPSGQSSSQSGKALKK